MRASDVKPRKTQATGVKPPVQPPTPNLDRISEIEPNNQIIGDFLAWLFERDIHLMRWDEHDVYRPCREWPDLDATAVEDLRQLKHELKGGEGEVEPVYSDEHPETCACKGTGRLLVSRQEDWVSAGPQRIKWWLAKYFDINEDKVEEERMAVLVYMRRLQGLNDDGSPKG